MSEYKRNPRGARRARKSMGRKAIVVLSLMMVLVLGAVGGTVAWLTSTPAAVTNTFTTAGVEITLTEDMNTDTNDDEINDKWEAKLIPGNTYAKNPTVTVLDSTDVPIWLFVKFEENGGVTGTSAYLNYTSTLTDANGWTQGNGTDIPSNVWYREVNPNDTTKSWALLKDNTVTVPDTLTKDDMPTADFSLVYTAYACQKDNRTAVEAWATVGN